MKHNNKMAPVLQEKPVFSIKGLPPWLKQEIPDMQRIRDLKKLFQESHLNTVCESAHCPNLGQCWGRGVATFMILGDVCTRSCRFCAVKTGLPSGISPSEPIEIAKAVRNLNLKYIVITSVTRDDLRDFGADQFARTVCHIKKQSPGVKVEVLIPDFLFSRESINKVIKSRPDVIGHNIETVRPLFPSVRPQADYQRSLDVLKFIKTMDPSLIVKSGFMVGLGEDDELVFEVMKDLREAGCDIVTIGQFLSPAGTARHLPVKRFVTPEEFENYQAVGINMGFKYVMSGPLVRSSYLAEKGYLRLKGVNRLL